MRYLLLALCLLAIKIASAQENKRNNAAVDMLPPVFTKQTVGKSGEFITLMTFSNDPEKDCSVKEASPAVRIVKLPANGALFLQIGSRTTRYPEKNPLSACNGKVVTALYLVYRSDAGFHGTDVFSVAVEQGTEGVTKMGYTVTVQ